MVIYKNEIHNAIVEMKMNYKWKRTAQRLLKKANVNTHTKCEQQKTEIFNSLNILDGHEGVVQHQRFVQLC
ncbi:Small ribosomal subunit protein [Trichinella spiralis]|uniref:Small ribosomal subunit protein n=1 Tax=Trichinella spiralis TaxID=6334 RepID=A0ABR3K8E4_TRISP